MTDINLIARGLHVETPCMASDDEISLVIETPCMASLQYNKSNDQK